VHVVSVSVVKVEHANTIPAGSEKIRIKGLEDTTVEEDGNKRKRRQRHQGGGLQLWDVIKSVGGNEIRSVEDLTHALRRLGPGGEAEFRVTRRDPQREAVGKGATSSLRLGLVLGGQPIGGDDFIPLQTLRDMRRIRRGDVRVSDWGKWYCPQDAEQVLDPTVVTTCAAAARRLHSELPRMLGVGVVNGPDGVHLSTVLPGSSAAEAGLREWDVVTALNGVAVTDAATVHRMLAEAAPGHVCVFQVQRRDGPHAVDAAHVTLEVRVPLLVPGVSFEQVVELRRVMRGALLADEVDKWTVLS
jgi:hypothetical protein